MTLSLLLALATALGADVQPSASSSEPGAIDVLAWTRSAAGVDPTVLGDPQVRATQELGLDLGINSSWQVQALSALRMRQASERFDTLDLYRMNITHRGQGYQLGLGRLTRLDPRGWERIDGVSFDTDAGGARATGIEAWGGRLWHPETWDVNGTYVGGARLSWRPFTRAGHTSSTRLTAGWEGRAADVFSQRLDLSGATYTPYGSSLQGHFEAQPGSDGGVRASMGGAAAMGATLLGGSVRWEGLAPAATDGATRVAWDWLGQGGYGIASADLRVRAQRIVYQLSGGPTWLPSDGLTPTQVGGQLRGGVGWLKDGVSVDVFGRGATVGGSALVGGGLQSEVQLGQISLQGLGAAYAFQALDGVARPLWECQLLSAAPLVHAGGPGVLDLTAYLGGGNTRQLQVFARGGVGIRGTLDRRRRGGR